MQKKNNNTLCMVEAINQALHYEMEHDKDVVVLGEDIAKNGGVFRATVDLLDAFGPERVIDTPLAESLIAGMTIGMATQSLKPVAEFQFMGFIYSAFDHIISHASRMRNRTESRLSCPLVYRAPYGGGIMAPEHHSESTEALFAHIPGLRVVIPSTPQAAYGLLLASIRCPDPVLFLEPKRLYRVFKQSVPDNGIAWPLDTSLRIKEGNDITLISWGASLYDTLKANELLAQHGISCDVIDVMSISPIDYIPMLESIKKTGRAVIVHEAARSCGVGADISANLSEYGFGYLKAPILRLTGSDTIMPYPIHEHLYMLSPEQIYESILEAFPDTVT